MAPGGILGTEQGEIGQHLSHGRFLPNDTYPSCGPAPISPASTAVRSRDIVTESVVQIQGHLFANLLNYRNKNVSQLLEKKEERIYKIVFSTIIQT